MPVIDLADRGATDSTALAGADVVVVGSGPSGTSLASELAGSGLRVLLLESGATDRTDLADALDVVESVGRPRAEDQWSVRNRVLGGSSHTWGGRCGTFDEIDFEHRPWVPHSGWPIDPATLKPYYDRSAAHLGLAVGSGYTGEEFWALAGRRKPPAEAEPDPSQLLSYFWQFSRDPRESYPFEYARFGRTVTERVGPETTVVLSATVTSVLVEPHGGAVRGVRVTPPSGQPFEVLARTVVLATGGVENARLLLASRETAQHGVGNDRDLVGRFLMDHPRGPVGDFDVTTTAQLTKRLGRYNVQGRFFRGGLRLSPELQRAEQLLNVSAYVNEQWSDDDPWAALRRIAGGHPSPREVAAVARNAPLLARGVKDYLVERNGVPRKLDGLVLLVMAEQRPDPDSRITLSDALDPFGNPLPRLDWRIHDDETRSMKRMAQVVAEQLPRMGLPAPRLEPWVYEDGELPPSFVDVAHPTGTTRMSSDPSTGVVDVDGQVHGVAGLYVVGSSTFPTAGHCNPTQLAVAMSVRLADHLRASVAVAPELAPAEHRPARPDETTVLLTGATGRIGRVVREDLLARGYRVRATTSRPVAEVSGAADGAGGSLEWRQVDLRTLDDATADSLLAGVHGVLHLAAEIGDQEVMEAVNHRATGTLARAAERAGVASFVYTSTVSVYGSARRRTVTEDSPTLTPDRDVPAEYLALAYVRAYGRTKLLGELAVREAASQTRYAVLRPTVVVDVHQVAEVARWGIGKRVIGGHRHAHHVYVRDVSDAAIWCLARGLAGHGAPGSVEVFNVSEDDAPGATHASFLRDAAGVTGDRKLLLPPAPGVLDWANDLRRFKVPALGNPLWRLRFSGDKLRAAGWRPPYGMSRARALALAELAAEAS
ncbi:Choline dehydrogenase [Quadrisphaera granulorum]|uniref:Choline dehydrogenase-like flavoprotein n=1 Tax=Quadrisphaera granulorum TaxID=317664 RepID=A0A316AY25_9ACTN|nr:GMC oxidoreductase [Quadrisphaera granulorum]PWJ55117.1 choline dehydrogenase-like flavoprotein [Quadrisphaera granulorum]SZE95626.1 Choline dehydrogenase [Quadrisphaera granulorum]